MTSGCRAHRNQSKLKEGFSLRCPIRASHTWSKAGLCFHSVVQGLWVCDQPSWLLQFLSRLFHTQKGCSCGQGHLGCDTSKTSPPPLMFLGPGVRTCQSTGVGNLAVPGPDDKAQQSSLRHPIPTGSIPTGAFNPVQKKGPQGTNGCPAQNLGGEHQSQTNHLKGLTPKKG